MKKYLFILVSLMLVSGVCASAQPRKARSFNRSGNTQFKGGHYQEAEMDYRRALNEETQDTVARFNLATSLICQQNQAKLQEADSLLNGLIMESSQAGNMSMAARALYQKGEIAMMAQQYDQAVNAFKASLKCNPNDNDARYNLLVAQKLLKQQQEQQQKQDQNKDQQQDKKEQQKQDQQKQQQDQQKQQDQQQKQQQDQQQQDQQQQQQQMSEDQRQSILEQNEREEKETQAKVMRRQQEKDNDKKREMEIKRMNGTLKDW